MKLVYKKRKTIMEMNLNPEEIQKINNLWKTSRFQRSWRAVQNIINGKDSVTNYFVRNIIYIYDEDSL